MAIFFFFNDTATTEIYTLSLHDALPICRRHDHGERDHERGADAPGELLGPVIGVRQHEGPEQVRSEEHTSELQSRQYLVCRLLLEKKKNKDNRLLLVIKIQLSL